MNPGIGLPELLVLAILALVVVGPKDLPLMLRKAGKFVGQAKSLANDFRRSLDEMGREAELAELRKEVESLKKANPINEIKDEVMAAKRDAETEPQTEPKIAPAETELQSSDKAPA